MISIIVPIYNVKEYLPKCIESICEQTYRDIEIILVDDGSTDGSQNICDEYAEKDSRIRVLHKENEGPVRARKDGLKVAEGDYIGHVDGDDWIEPDMFHKLYHLISTENVEIAMCGRYEDTGDLHRQVFQGLPEGRYDKERLIKEIYPNMIVNGAFFEWGLFPGMWDKLFKRECLEKYEMAVDDRLRMGDDAACVYPCILNAGSIYICRECLYHYRQSASSLVKQQKDPETERMRFNILYNSVLKAFEEYKGIYDLREQWREYLLFLMTPRADFLYKDIDKLDYLFPFKSVKRGSNIILYGMGTYGQSLYKHIKRTGICNIAACADRNYIELNKQGLSVISPEKMDDYEFDYIVVANSFYKVRSAVYEELTQRFGEKKVQTMEVELIKSDESLKAFGLITG